MVIRKTRTDDMDAVLNIYAEARKYMRESGNLEQWANGYPAREDVLSDIAEGASYVCEDGGEVVAVFYFKEGTDPTYANIYEGEWQNGDPYAVIHRIAVKYHGRGIVNFCFSECFGRFPNLKIDTHKDNLPMQKALIKNGFKYCGIIYLGNGDARLAYQKCE